MGASAAREYACDRLAVRAEFSAVQADIWHSIKRRGGVITPGSDGLSAKKAAAVVPWRWNARSGARKGRANDIMHACDCRWRNRLPVALPSSPCRNRGLRESFCDRCNSALGLPASIDRGREGGRQQALE